MFFTSLDLRTRVLGLKWTRFIFTPIDCTLNPEARFSPVLCRRGRFPTRPSRSPNRIPQNRTSCRPRRLGAAAAFASVSVGTGWRPHSSRTIVLLRPSLYRHYRRLTENATARIATGWQTPTGPWAFLGRAASHGNRWPVPVSRESVVPRLAAGAAAAAAGAAGAPARCSDRRRRQRPMTGGTSYCSATTSWRAREGAVAAGSGRTARAAGTGTLPGRTATATAAIPAGRPVWRLRWPRPRTRTTDRQCRLYSGRRLPNCYCPRPGAGGVWRPPTAAVATAAAASGPAPATACIPPPPIAVESETPCHQLTGVAAGDAADPAGAVVAVDWCDGAAAVPGASSGS